MISVYFAPTSVEGSDYSKITMQEGKARSATSDITDTVN